MANYFEQGPAGWGRGMANLTLSNRHFAIFYRRFSLLLKIDGEEWPSFLWRIQLSPTVTFAISCQLPPAGQISDKVSLELVVVLTKPSLEGIRLKRLFALQVH